MRISKVEMAMLVGTGVSVVTSIGAALYAISNQSKAQGLISDYEKRASDIELTARTNIQVLNESINQKLMTKVDGIAASLGVNVPDEIVREALDKAARGAADQAIRGISSDVMGTYRNEIRSEVRKTVDLAYDNVKGDVKSELERQISNIDISGIKRDIIREAKEKVEDELEDLIEKARDDAADKFEEELDSIATRFNSDLERGSKIYKTLADKLGT